MCKIAPKHNIKTTVTSYYVTVVFDLPCESESRFTMYRNPDSLIEYPLKILLVLSKIAVLRQYE